MRSTDAVSLKREQVDIKSSLSVDVQVKVGSKVNRDDFDRRDFDVPSPSPDGADIQVEVFDKRGPPTQAPAPTSNPTPATSSPPIFGGAFGISVGKDFSQMSSSEAVSRVSNKVENVKEISFGGSPPIDGDWKTWAESVANRT